MSTAVKRRRGTSAQHAAFTGQLAEVTVDTDKKTLVVHDGATLGGFPLARQTMGNVLEFGAVGDGVTNDRAAIVAAMASVLGFVYFPAGVYNIGATGIVVPSTCRRIVMHPNAYISYTGTGIAVDIPDCAGTCEYELDVRKTVADWDPMTGTGADTTSVGIRLKNCAFARVKVNLVLHFAIGLQLYSDGAGGASNGTQFNHIHLINITNNKVGMQFVATGGGWCNQNFIYGGSFAISSGQTSQLAGSRFLEITNGNTNTFYGICLQGDTAQYALRVADNGNQFLNARFEQVQANGVRFEATANYNQIIGGYFDSGTYSIVNDLNGSNSFYGATGIQVSGDIANNPLDIKNGTTGRSMLKQTNKVGGGRFIVSNATDKHGAEIFGLTICRQSQLMTKGANVTVTAGGDLTLGSDGNFFSNNNGAATLKAILGTNWTYGSIIVISSFFAMTVKHNTAGSDATFKKIMLAGSVDFAMSAYGSLTLIYDDRDVWQEISRSNP